MSPTSYQLLYPRYSFIAALFQSAYILYHRITQLSSIIFNFLFDKFSLLSCCPPRAADPAAQTRSRYRLRRSPRRRRRAGYPRWRGQATDRCRYRRLSVRRGQCGRISPRSSAAPPPADIAFIEHGQAHAVAGFCGRNLNALSLRRVADSVGQVIHQHLIEQIAVCADRNMRVLIFHGQTSIFTQNSGFAHRFRTKCHADQYPRRTSALHPAPAAKD